MALGRIALAASRGKRTVGPFQITVELEMATINTADLDQLARRRAQAKMGCAPGWIGVCNATLISPAAACCEISGLVMSLVYGCG
jgi:hypothetical protein